MPDFPLSKPDLSQEPQPEAELRLLLDWEGLNLRPATQWAPILSAVFHVLLFVVGFSLPKEFFQSPGRHSVAPPPVPRQVTPLVAPKFELTQKDPQKGPVKQEVNAEELLASLQKQKTPRAFTPPPSRPAQPEQATPKPLEAPPQITAPPVDTKQLAQLGAPEMPAPQIPPPDQKKKSPFENIGQANASPRGVNDGRIPAPPRQSLEEMARPSPNASQGSSGTMVSDLPDLSNPLQNQKKTGSTLELLSDPQGVDFRPYLIKILAIVKRNWFAVIPESTRFGRRGKTMIQFSISRDGRVPKLVISGPSGTEALDRAAVAGISASNPFPPLPAEFKGDLIRLQFGFSYNMP
jgi:TonB family protein